MSQSHLKQNLLAFLRKQPNADARRAAVENELINAESALGRTLFGDVAPGHQREFFMHKKNVWIWHEDGMTIRYEVRSNGVFAEQKQEYIDTDDCRSFKCLCITNF